MHLTLLADIFGVLRLEPPASFPAWLANAKTCFLAQTPDEVSIICPQHIIPHGLRFEGGWRCYRLEGELPFEVVGVAAALTTALAEADIPLLINSTYDRDYVLVKQEFTTRAEAAFQAAGFEVAAPS